MKITDLAELIEADGAIFVAITDIPDLETRNLSSTSCQSVTQTVGGDRTFARGVELK